MIYLAAILYIGVLLPFAWWYGKPKKVRFIAQPGCREPRYDFEKPREAHIWR
jgi:hypothetical protein